MLGVGSNHQDQAFHLTDSLQNPPEIIANNSIYQTTYCDTTYLVNRATVRSTTIFKRDHRHRHISCSRLLTFLYSLEDWALILTLNSAPKTEKTGTGGDGE